MKKNYLIPLFLVSICSLTSCDIYLGGLLGSNSVAQSISHTPIGDGNYYQPDSLNYTLQDLNKQMSWVTSETTGEQKMLIVPVQLVNEKKWTDEMISNLENSFFGTAENNDYESVNSYFYKSSYGNLNLTGEVTTPLVSSYTKKELDLKATEAPNYIISDFYKSASASLLKKYDLNNDGYIDNTVFIYSNNYSTADESAYWAWCYAYDTESNITKPTVNNYMWASYQFLEKDYIDGYRKTYIDSHTYIHETGHLLGLDDYYCYDSENAWDCAGYADMQAYNIGDHNIYSKIALGWVKPYVVMDSTKIVLKTSALYPQAILINDNWNGSAFDEYILIEYYSPKGLNEVDSKHNFDGSGLMYNGYGLRIYHIDARLIHINSKGEFVEYTNKIERSSRYVTYVGASNSYCYSYLNAQYAKKYRYVHLLDQGNYNKLNNGNGGTLKNSSVLWTNKTFTPSSVFFANGDKFNNGEKIGYSVTPSELTEEDCLVTIEKI